MRTAKQAVMAFGPLASVAAGMATLQGHEVAAFAWAMFLLWSPLPVSIPSLLMQRTRDAALPGVSGAARAVMLLPHLLLEAKDRDATAAMIGWVAILPLVLSL